MKRHVLPAWTGPESPQSPVPVDACDNCRGTDRVAFNALLGQQQCGPCRDLWTETELHLGRPGADLAARAAASALRQRALSRPPTLW